MPERAWATVATPNRPDARVSVWTPDCAPKAVVQIFHGMAEHIERYDRTARDLVARGYAVAGHDHMGHGPGTPEGKLGYFYAEDGWRKIVEDGHAVSDWLRGRFPGAPLVLLGHSMGSFMARDYVMRYPGEPDALILSGTGWYPPALCHVARAMARLAAPDRPAPRIHKLGFSGNNKPFEPARTPNDWLSRNTEEVDKYIADPLCGFVFTGRAYYDLFTGLLGLTRLGGLEHVPVTMPVCFISGDSDPVGQMGKGVLKVSQQFMEAGIKDVTVRLYHNARHELFNEMNRAEVINDLCGWLDETVRKLNRR